MAKTIVLVYSGGLDTSVCIPMLREEYGYDRIVTVTVDVGQPADDVRQAEHKAKALGTEHTTVDARRTFIENYCWPAVRANGDYEGYPLSTAIARPLIALSAVEEARKIGAAHFGHGCTGKGNDQFRIEFRRQCGDNADARMAAGMRFHRGAENAKPCRPHRHRRPYQAWLPRRIDRARRC